MLKHVLTISTKEKAIFCFRILSINYFVYTKTVFEEYSDIFEYLNIHPKILDIQI